MTTMIWLSADLSKSCSGLALWHGETLLSVACLRPYGAKGKHKYYDSEVGEGRSFASDIEAKSCATNRQTINLLV